MDVIIATWEFYFFCVCVYVCIRVWGGVYSILSVLMPFERNTLNLFSQI